MPSTKTVSPAANNVVVNPRIGVVSVQVAIPKGLVVIETIPTPFELLTEIILCGSESKPNSGTSCSISEIAPFGALATKDVESTSVFVVSFQTIRSGSVRYLAPGFTTSKPVIVSRLSILTIGGTIASGLKVLSEG